MSVKPHCKPFEHGWSIETVSGNVDANTGIELMLRCKRCHATMKGKVER